MKKDYENMHEWDIYSEQLLIEYQQSMDEGLDIEQYQGLFHAISKMPKGEEKERMADVLFDLVRRAPQREGYSYVEPSELDKIKELRDPRKPACSKIPENYEDKLRGAWVGRICGCLLGKPVEGKKVEEIEALLKSSGNYPLQRYILSSDITPKLEEKYQYNKEYGWADKYDCAPVDDDTNYVVLASVLIERYGRDFTPKNVADLWLELQNKSAYCTAERVAFRNFVAGYAPPVSAVYKNPYREWIGAQIRGDYFGYINPGNPEAAAEMAWRDASISHTKNGIYGEMFVAAMIAQAAVCNDMEEIIQAGLGEIPNTSRLHEVISTVISNVKSGMPQETFFEKFYEKYDEYSHHDVVHTIANAEIVAAALLYGGGDFEKSICLTVQAAFDTDCNGATVGSIVGMRNGIKGIDEKWTKPLHGMLDTSIFGVGKVKIEEMVKKTMKHLAG